MISTHIILMFATLFGSYLIGYPLKNILLKFNVLDIPNSRSNHTSITVRGGGIGVIIFLIIGGLAECYLHKSISGAVVFICALLLSVVSFYDDIFKITAKIRFIFQCLFAVVGLSIINYERNPDISQMLDSNLITLNIVLFLLIISYINAFNFMDGINGISAIQAFTTSIGTAIFLVLYCDKLVNLLPMLYIITGLVAIGFIPHNFPLAKMFLGDVGSVTLGYIISILACWSIISYGFVMVIPLTILHLNYLLDTSITLLRRIVAQKNWYEAHSEHFYQKLIKSGFSHVRVTTIHMILQVIMVLLAVLFPAFDVFGKCIIIFICLAIWSSYLLFVERRYNHVIINEK